MGVDNIHQAKMYLESRGHGEVQLDPVIGMILLIDGVGDGSWERDVAEAHGWSRKDNGICCYKYRKLHPDALCCVTCYAGINGNAAWKREPPADLGDGFDRRLNA